MSLPAERDRDFNKIVHHGGRNFVASRTMVAIFEAHARDVLARDEFELVPLLHHDGVDLLLIGPGTVFAVVNVGIGLGDRHAAAARSAQSRWSGSQTAASVLK